MVAPVVYLNTQPRSSRRRCSSNWPHRLTQALVVFGCKSEIQGWGARFGVQSSIPGIYRALTALSAALDRL